MFFGMTHKYPSTRKTGTKLSGTDCPHQRDRKRHHISWSDQFLFFLFPPSMEINYFHFNPFQENYCATRSWTARIQPGKSTDALVQPTHQYNYLNQTASSKHIPKSWRSLSRRSRRDVSEIQSYSLVEHFFHHSDWKPTYSEPSCPRPRLLTNEDKRGRRTSSCTQFSPPARRRFQDHNVRFRDQCRYDHQSISAHSVFAISWNYQLTREGHYFTQTFQNPNFQFFIEYPPPLEGPQSRVTNSIPFDNTWNPNGHFQLEIDSDKTLASSQNQIAKNLSISICTERITKPTVTSISRQLKGYWKPWWA